MKSLGTFIVSLDFELHWGAAEKWDLSQMHTYFDNTRKSIPIVLNQFKKFDIKATWATVGFLFAKNYKQLNKFCPSIRPTYENENFNYYQLIDNGIVGIDEDEDPYHYAPSLIRQILKTPGQELASHTFCHYYCTEAGQTVEQFDADLRTAQALAKENFDIQLQSLVFPRNQVNPDYLSMAAANGIKVARSNPVVWFWKLKSPWISAARAVDSLFPISSPLTFKHNSFEISNDVLLLPSSRFLRTYTAKERLVHNLKLNRIKKEMTYAAVNNEVYHLWWHPHNFGTSMKENLLLLKSILEHYRFLHSVYGFKSKTMIEMC